MSTWSLLAPEQLSELGVDAPSPMGPGGKLPKKKKIVLPAGPLPGADEGQVQPNPMAMVQHPASQLDIGGAAPGQAAAAMAQSMPLGPNGKPMQGLKADESLTNQNNFKRGINRLLTKPMDQFRAERLMAQGIYPKVKDYEQAVDDNGEPIYVDPLGRKTQAGLPGAQPMKDKDRPMYDLKDTETDANDPIQQQKAGLARMEGLLRLQANANKSKSLLDLSPLAKLTDAWSRKNPHMSDNMTPPEDPTKGFMAYADEIQKRGADINKETAQNAAALKGGTTMDQLTQALIAKQAAGVDTTKTDRAQLAEAQRAWRTHQAVLSAVDKDPTLKNLLQSGIGLDTTMNTLAQAKSLTPQQIKEAQRSVMTSMTLARGGTSGIDERAQMYLNDIGQDADRVKQWLTGAPVNISQNDPMVKHIKNLINIEKESIGQNYSKVLNGVSAGSGWLYDQPDYSGADPAHNYKQALMDKLSAKQAAMSGSGNAPRASAHKASGPKAGGTAVKGFDPDAYLKGRH